MPRQKDEIERDQADQRHEPEEHRVSDAGFHRSKEKEH
jgi:hypothetical protein